MLSSVWLTLAAVVAVASADCWQENEACGTHLENGKKIRRADPIDVRRRLVHAHAAAMRARRRGFLPVILS